MTTYNDFLIIGCGRMARGIAAGLRKLGVLRVRVWDRDVEAMTNLERDAQQSPLIYAACDAQASPKLHRGTTVFSTLGPADNIGWMETAIEAHSHWVDLNADSSQWEQNGKAQQHGSICLPDCGLAPGMSQVLARMLFGSFAKPRAIGISCGGLPQTPSPPWMYECTWNVEGLVAEYSGTAEARFGNEVINVPALSDIADFHGVIRNETWHVTGLERATTRGGLSTLVHRLPVPILSYGTLRYRGHFHLMKAVLDAGLLESEPARQRFISSLPVTGRDIVVLAGCCVDENACTLHVVCIIPPADGLTAMQRATGFAAALAWKHGVLLGNQCGVLPIDEAVDCGDVFNEWKQMTR